MAAPESPARVLIRAPNWLGDAILAVPAMAAIRRHFGAADLTVATAASVAPLFRERTPVRPARVIALAGHDRTDRAAIAAVGANLAILLTNSFRSAWQIRRAGVPARWGYAASGRGLLLTRRVGRPRRRDVRHQADYYRALVTGLDIPCPAGDRPAFELSPASVAAADAALHRVGVAAGERLVVMLPGAAYGQAKQWPADRAADLAARLVRDRGVVCVLAGAAHDRPAARAIESRLRAHAPHEAGRVVDLVGHTSLGAFLGVLGRATVCVTNDSGGMHAASALGRPVVALFGPTDERATSPKGDHDLLTASVFCRPCMLRDCPIDHRCMTRITIDRVYDAVARRLETAGGAHP